MGVAPILLGGILTTGFAEISGPQSSLQVCVCADPRFMAKSRDGPRAGKGVDSTVEILIANE